MRVQVTWTGNNGDYMQGCITAISGLVIAVDADVVSGSTNTPWTPWVFSFISASCSIASSSSPSTAPSVGTSSSSQLPTCYVVTNAGQSNAVSYAGASCTASLDTPDPRLRMWGTQPVPGYYGYSFYNTSVPAVCPLPTPDVNQGQELYYEFNQTSYFLTFCNQYVANHLGPNDIMIAVDNPYGGTGFAGGPSGLLTWSNAAPNALPGTTVSLTNAAIVNGCAGFSNVVFLGILWCQGEEDYCNFPNIDAVQYSSSLQTISTYFRSEIIGATAQTPFIIVPPNIYNVEASYTTATFCGGIFNNPQLILNTILNATSYIAYAAVVNNTGIGNNPVNVHYSGPDQRALGHLAYNAFFLAKNNSYPPSNNLVTFYPQPPSQPQLQVVNAGLENMYLYYPTARGAVTFSFFYSIPGSGLFPTFTGGSVSQYFLSWQWDTVGVFQYIASSAFNTTVVACNFFGCTYSPFVVVPTAPPPSLANQNFKLIPIGSTSLNVSWNFIPDASGFILLRYELDFTDPLGLVSWPNLYYYAQPAVLTGLTIGVNYTFRFVVSGPGGSTTLNTWYVPGLSSTGTNVVSSSSSVHVSSISSSTRVPTPSVYIFDNYTDGLVGYSALQLSSTAVFSMQVMLLGVPTNVPFNNSGIPVGVYQVTIIYDQSGQGNHLQCTASRNVVYRSAGDATSNYMPYIFVNFSLFLSNTNLCQFTKSSLTVPTNAATYFFSWNPDDTGDADTFLWPVYGSQGSIQSQANVWGLHYPNSDVGNSLSFGMNSYQDLLPDHFVMSSTSNATFAQGFSTDQTLVTTQAVWSGDAVPSTIPFSIFILYGSISLFNFIIFSTNLSATQSVNLASSQYNIYG
jgi:hypothetical protein